MDRKEELVLKILSSVDVIKGKTKFVKILHLTCKLFVINKKESPFEFRPDRYGVYPPDLEPVLVQMEKENYIHINKSFFSKRQDLSAVDRSHVFQNETILEMSKKIAALSKALNEYSSDEIIAISYHLFPDTTIKSEIKPEINKKIVELFSPLSSEFEEPIEEEISMESISSNVKALYPQFNDLDARMHIMKSLNLKEVPPIIPDMIDESTGLLAKKHPFFKKYDLEEMLKDARRR